MSVGPTSGWSGQPSPPSPYLAYPPVPVPSERFFQAWQRRTGTDYIFNFWTALGWTLLTLGL